MSAAHAPFQHAYGAAAGHATAQLAASSVHAPPLALQRYGVSAGHGHALQFAAQLMSPHNTIVAMHTVSHTVAFATHAPVEQRCGVNGGQGHSRIVLAHVESQHCVSVDGHVVHRSFEPAHRPVLAHTVMFGGHAATHAPPMLRHRPVGHVDPFATAQHGVSMHCLTVVLK